MNIKKTALITLALTASTATIALEDGKLSIDPIQPECNATRAMTNYLINNQNLSPREQQALLQQYSETLALVIHPVPCNDCW
jgi:hypothetical protein